MKNIKLKAENSFKKERTFIENSLSTSSIINHEEEMKIEFWGTVDGKTKIIHNKLIKFLNQQGFAKIRPPKSTDFIIVREINNRVKLSSEAEAIEVLKDYLEEIENIEILELLNKGISSFINTKKMYFLRTINEPNDRDLMDCSFFYFKNYYVSISKKEINPLGYGTLKRNIWENRILNHYFDFPDNKCSGDFEKFCYNLSKKDDKRFLALKTALGYLMHRNKDNVDVKAIILYDENMGIDSKAHGGTGKTLLSQALSKCREVVTYDGRDNKRGNWFKNQRINLTTDIIVHDDLDSSTNFEDYFAALSTGIEVEKKRKDSFFIDFSRSPKYFFASNYYINGPGGSSDRRRRYEFEIANHYSDTHTPFDEFGDYFFGRNWGKEQWHKFYFFMMKCVQSYLKHGLVPADPINLQRAEELAKWDEKVLEYLKAFVNLNEIMDKRELQKEFEEIYPDIKKSPHQWKKYLDQYAEECNCTLKTISTGGKYLFILNTKGSNDEEE